MPIVKCSASKATLINGFDKTADFRPYWEPRLFGTFWCSECHHFAEDKKANIDIGEEDENGDYD